jgi:hypothetical protein
MFIRSNPKSALFLWEVPEMDVTIVEKFLKSFFGGPLLEGMPPKAAYLGKVAFQDVRSKMTFRRSYISKRRKFLGF